MPRSNARRLNHDDGHGFVLVGVVMFVLALTILGLSLFSLSSYEGQFANRSHDSGQALLTAQSGIEHAKFVLAHGGVLEAVGSPLFPDSVTYARASYLNGATLDSVGSIDSLPPDTPILLRVNASVNGQRRMVQVQYLPQKTRNLYGSLMSVSGQIKTMAFASDSAAACGHYDIGGRVFQGDGTDLVWASCSGTPLSMITPLAPVPEPSVASFISDHIAAAAKADIHSDKKFTLSGGTFSATFLKTVDSDERRLCSLYVPAQPGSGPEEGDVDPGTITITVEGWVVWLLPEGLRIDRKVRVVAGEGGGEGGGGGGGSGPTLPQDCLVIVAGASTDPDSPGHGQLGIEFKSSIDSPEVPIILVTDAWVFDQHWYAPYNTQPASVAYLSIFAAGASFWGPGTGTMRLSHDSNSPFDAPGGLIDQLCDQNALPNSESGRMTFKPVAGTWRELNPDDPDSPPN